MDGATIILNVAYIALVAATATRTVLWLRLALITAAGFFVIYGIVTDLPSMVFWNTITGLLHSLQLFRHVRARLGVSLSESDEHARSELFPDLDRFDFHCLWSLGEPAVFRDEPIAVQDAPQDTTVLLLDGVAEVRRDAAVLARVAPGQFVGEMSLVSGSAANASAWALGTVTTHSWRQDRLNTLDELNPRASRALHRLIEKDLVRKAS